ncbi:PEGA domain-containing protein [Candidatus Palauibacter sp.]|uniref:PEGA domain-containing protein n=1 Tax=Candidatus Palauibacter sp. TaxID=3101350 RepID=UPI003B5C8DB0
MARLPALCLVVVATTACGTLFNSKIKTINMTSSPVQAEVWIDGMMRGMTPLSLELDNQTSHTVVFRKEGHTDVVCELNSGVGAGWIILDVLGGLIPIIVDAVTGDWNGISEDACHVNLPTPPPAVQPQSGLIRMADENGWVTFQ